VDVKVAFNVITLAGEVYRRSDAEILGRLAGDVDGAVDVINNLTYRWDDVGQHAGVN
jgi:osmotically-inducible protein OsmY